MKKHLKSFLGILLITGFLILPFLVFAQENPEPEGIVPSQQSSKSLDKLILVGKGTGFNTDISLPAAAGKVLNVFLGLLGIIFVILIIRSGFKWLMAGGDEKQVEDAKKYITRAVMGLIITLSAWGIWNFIQNRLLG